LPFSFARAICYNRDIMKILVTGASGLLGHAVAVAARASHRVVAQYLRNAPGGLPGALRLDLTDGAAVRAAFAETAPACVMHCAAMADPAGCERERDRAKAINVEATRLLARLCSEHDARLVFISTDLVFDGRRGMYVEEDPVNPVSYYGETKALAEKAVRGECPNHVIARCCLMYGRSPTGGRGADEVMLHALREGKEVRLFTDEYRTPVCVPDLARALVRLAEAAATGTFHCGGGERVSRYDFGLKICRAAGVDSSRIMATRIEEAQCVPPRAPDVSLDSSKLKSALGVSLLDVDGGLKLLYHSDA